MSDQNQPTDRRQDPTDGEDQDQDQEFAFLVESRLTAFGVYLTDFEESDDGYAITYESIASDETGSIPHREVGRIVNVFRDVEDDPVAINGTVTDLDGEPMGEWRSEREWLAALEDGDMTELEFSEQVIDSIEPVHGDPP